MEQEIVCISQASHKDSAFKVKSTVSLLISDFTELFWNENVARCLVSLNGFTWLFKGEEVVLTFGKMGEKV